ncbi:hypothetical protein PInf_022633 [Phytophthora infestans]|nr:hypothetical protein PInf_022633 [Phytophthora infestans]
MLKDVSNMIAEMRRNSYTSPDDNMRVTEALQDFGEGPKTVADVFRDADTKLTSCITFKTAHMRRTARLFPEHALIDGETQENMKSAITAFKRNNKKLE